VVTLQTVQFHPGLIYSCNCWHTGVVALRAERQSACMSEIKTRLDLDCRV